MDQLTTYLASGSLPLMLAAGLFCAAAVLRLFVVLSRQPEAAPAARPAVPQQQAQVDYLERMMDDEASVATVPFGIGEVVAGAARTGRAMGLTVSVISRDETAEGVPDDIATVLDCLVSNVSRQGEQREVLLRSERYGQFVEVTVGPAGPVGDGGLGLQISRQILREQGGDLLLRDTDTGAAFVARIPAVRVPVQRVG